MTYDLESIKKAFWQTFHMSGEWWFTNWPEEQERADRNTNAAWEEFLDYLRLNTTFENGPLENLIKDQDKLDSVEKSIAENCTQGGFHDPKIESSMYGYPAEYVCSKCGEYLKVNK